MGPKQRDRVVSRIRAVSVALLEAEERPSQGAAQAAARE